MIKSRFLFCFFFFFLIIDLYFLTAAFITQNFNPSEELLIPIAISANEAKAEMETHHVTAESKIRKCSIQFRNLQIFLRSLLINSLQFISTIK